MTKLVSKLISPEERTSINIELFKRHVEKFEPKSSHPSRRATIITNEEMGNVRYNATLNPELFCEIGDYTPTHELIGPERCIFSATRLHRDKDGNLVGILTPVGKHALLGLIIINNEELYLSLKAEPVFKYVNNERILHSILFKLKS